jgi:hypothetical protein
VYSSKLCRFLHSDLWLSMEYYRSKSVGTRRDRRNKAQGGMGRGRVSGDFHCIIVFRSVAKLCVPTYAPAIKPGIKRLKSPIPLLQRELRHNAMHPFCAVETQFYWTFQTFQKSLTFSTRASRQSLYSLHRASRPPLKLGHC